jgi:phage terminase small subunit
MTGKQSEFVRQYLGPCRFNATAAAKASGYRCTSEHSFQEVGVQNLKNPAIRAAIDEHFKLSRMTAQEVLQELAQLARGNGREKLRALALLAQANGVLDGSYLNRPNDDIVEQKAELLAQKKLDEYANELSQDVERFNQAALESNKKKDRAMLELQRLFAHNSEAVQALKLMREVALEYKTIEQVREELKPRLEPEPEVEIIIPEARRLGPCAAERLLEPIIPEVVEPEPPPPCNHGYNSADCYICDHIASTQRAWFG